MIDGARRSVLIAAAFLAWACGTNSGAACGPGTRPRGEACEPVTQQPTKSVSCGPGTHVDNGKCIATVIDAGGGAADSSGHTESGSDAATDGPAESAVIDEPDLTPPVFSGVSRAESASDTAIRVSWDPATDDRTDGRALVYRVFVSTTSGGQDYSAPTIVTEPGATSAVVGGLEHAPTTYFFVVRARDAAGNEDRNTHEVNAQAGFDQVPPVFSGCLDAVEAGSSEIRVSWAAATDEVTPRSEIEYRIWAGESEAAVLARSGQPSRVVTGTVETTFSGLLHGKRYFFYCEAVDAAGNPDGNARSASLLFDDPPTWTTLFVTDVGTTFATLTWPPADDDATLVSDIVYLIHVEGGAAPLDFVTAPGASSFKLTGLASSTYYSVTAHARDGAGQLDRTGPTTGFRTLFSFSFDIQPKFTAECATSGCHDATAAGGLVLTAGQSYSALVGKTAQGPAASVPDWLLVDTTTSWQSYLYIKLRGQPWGGMVGSFMPLEPDGGSSGDPALADLVLYWIQAGAPNN